MRKTFLTIIGIVLTLVGLLGFVNNPVLGIFPVNGLHNLVHLLSGILCLVFAFQDDGKAKKFALIFGLVYLVVVIIGFAAPDAAASLLAIDSSDNWLHVVLSIVFILLAIV
ncbi:MAG TPA: DUF4383 domain-containing protein [Patescibacteria group bacterium]|nr:DUF4383 domain-containing protein [Patescibacteria group bacterium]